MLQLRLHNCHIFLLPVFYSTPPKANLSARLDGELVGDCGSIFLPYLHDFHIFLFNRSISLLLKPTCLPSRRGARWWLRFHVLIHLDNYHIFYIYLALFPLLLKPTCLPVHWALVDTSGARHIDAIAQLIFPFFPFGVFCHCSLA